MKSGEIFWALAPDYAQTVFERLASRKESGSEQCSGPDIAEIASLIARREGAVAVVKISGALGRETRVSSYGGEIWLLGQDAVRAAIQSALDDASVRSILLSIDSPGGVVAGTKELADFIASASAQKPIAAYCDGLCASAAFWLASATGHVFAPATAQVGSIGVIMTMADMSGFFQRMGVKFEHIASGKYKAAGRGELSDEERAYFQDKLAQLHAIFKNDVKAALGITAPEAEWAEAQILVGVRARTLGLVSEIVRDEAAAIAILQEETMPLTLEKLKAEAPDLLARIEAEAFKKGAASAPDSLCQAAFRAVCSDEIYEAGAKLLAKALELKLSAAQLEGMASAFRTAPPAQAQRDAALEAILASHPAPLNADTPKPAKSALVADAEARQGGK